MAYFEFTRDSLIIVHPLYPRGKAAYYNEGVLYAPVSCYWGRRDADEVETYGYCVSDGLISSHILDNRYPNRLFDGTVVRVINQDMICFWDDTYYRRVKQFEFIAK